MTPRALPLSLLLVAGAALAEPMFYDLVDVPLARLIENAELRVKLAPTNVSRLHQLARLHGMAYASKRFGPEAT
ncbi:MAG: hypothetical protein KDD82_17135, partial [Planctomycetes bacterium]|nr:hypothetical protein [Planctomycetota bacterium]